MSNIINLSGGKDSTAMLHWMLEKGEDIHSVVFFDTGWEFPEMYDHLDQIERNTGIEIIRLKPKRSFDYWMFERKIVNKETGLVYKIGRGWPDVHSRWCTREKVNTLNKYHNSIKDTNKVINIGVAIDEYKRIKNKDLRYPLVEYKKTEKDCLEYCYKLGYTWNGLYKRFKRVSCFCCPLKSLQDFRILRKFYPELWSEMLDKGKRISDTGYKKFNRYDTIFDLEERFLQEDKQLSIF